MELFAIAGAIVLLLVTAVLTVRFIAALFGVAVYGIVLLLATLAGVIHKCEREKARSAS